MFETIVTKTYCICKRRKPGLTQNRKTQISQYRVRFALSSGEIYNREVIFLRKIYYKEWLEFTVRVLHIPLQ